MSKKLDFKKEAKRVGNFAMRFKDLEEPILISQFGPFFKSKIDLIYWAGLIVLAFCFISSFFRLPSVTGMLGGWIGVAISFIVLRMLCEVLAAAPAKKETSAAAPSAPAKTVAKPAVKKTVAKKK